ncbi:hypothetical protein OCK74_12060 [Chitinophagaceae bacterium LB-8]|uniref:Uncharacterized protein n=1 Tax=Paraflavisolibacter caeni TaxID=2982496 RepID=A0A9X2XWB6_9BACT|nr:hypothetical protein [Paraflavisolibacter caeni]MCU7549856.1 hypothetical protein [Paraflavisolibacter caeni]
MSYLNTLRFHFAGDFFSNPSTVNNDPAHYENALFDRSTLWKRQDATGMNGWWNPEGAHAFRFQNVKTTAAFHTDGTPVQPASDAVLSLNVESRIRNSAKMVDLDPDQQLVSMIFGLRISLTNDDGDELLAGIMDPAPFTEIWQRGNTGAGDERASAAYQSTVNVTSWGDLSSSLFLQQLKAASSDVLSIKFNVDGYVMSFDSPRFATGRVVGSIGTASAAEPKHFIAGRHFETAARPNDIIFPGFRPVNGINYCVGIHDITRNKFRLDLGNALPVTPSKGPINTAILGQLFLGCKMADGTVKEIDEIPYAGGNWYETSAGIVEVPANRTLTANENSLINSSVVCILSQTAEGKKIITEEANGSAYVRADMFVARMNPGDATEIKFFATQFGKPLPKARISFAFSIPRHIVVADFPSGGLNFPSSIQTDAAGLATLRLQAIDPGNARIYYTETFPREHIDGQVYRINYGLIGRRTPNISDFLSVLVWNTFTPDNPITWHGSMKDVMTQFGDMYPIMANDQNISLDLADYEQISQQRLKILHVVKLTVEDPMYMPVTRDLSRTRQEALIKWLENVGADGKPLLGTPPVVPHYIATNIPLTHFSPASDPGSKTIFGEKMQKNSVNKINLESND